MKNVKLPSIRVEPEFRAEVEAVLGEGETLSQFVEASVRANVARRRVHSDFIERGLRSSDAARRSGDYLDAEIAAAHLQRKLEAARNLVIKRRN